MQVDKDKKTVAGVAQTREADDERPSILIIEGRFYDEINDELVKGATNELAAQGCGYEVITVPGALEIPVALALAIETDVVGQGVQHRGVVALGCVIRGETSHYDIVANESARALMQLATDYAIPLGNGILTTDTLEQAQKRAAHDGYDKGGHAARACLSLISLQEDFVEREFFDEDDADA